MIIVIPTGINAKAFGKLAMIAGLIGAAALAVLACLIFAVGFVVHLMWSVLVQVCLYADGQNVLTRLLLLLVLSYGLYQICKYSARGARVFLRW